MARMTKEELSTLLKAVTENNYFLDGVERQPYGNGKTAAFVEQYGIDAADELIEFIVTRPEKMFFSPSHSFQKKNGEWVWEEDAWVLKRYSPKYRSVAYMKVWHLNSDARRQIDVHP